MKKLSLLSVSLLVVSSGVLLPSLPMMISEYTSIPPIWIEFLVTAPALFTLGTVFFSPKLAQQFGYKRMVQLGLILVIASGLAPIFLSSFTILLICRVLFGIGIGFFHPLLFSFSSSFYKNQELSDMVGYQSAFEGTGGIIVSALVAYLIAFGWRQTLWVYIISLPILLLFSFFVPDISVNETSKHKGHYRLEFGFWLQMLCLFILISVYSSISVKLTTLVTEVGFGTARDSSLGLASIGLGSMVAGFVFGSVYRLVKHWLAPLSILLLALSVFGLSLAQNSWMMLVLTFVAGLSFRSFVPFLLNIANQTQDASGEHRTTLLLASINIGSALAPFIIRFFQLSLQTEKVTTLFRFEAILVLILAILTTFIMLRNTKN